MALNLGTPFLLSHPSSFFSPFHKHKDIFYLLLSKNLETSPISLSKKSSIGGARASISETPRNGVTSSSSSCELVLDDELIRRVSRLKDASEVLEMIAEKLKSETKRDGGVLSCDDCRRIISAALDCGNCDLALSVFAAMRSSSFTQVLKENGGLVDNWKWSRPDLSIHTTLVLGLAASLRVSDALNLVFDLCRVGASSGEEVGSVVLEVPFGKVVRCPTCLIAVAVAQPRQGIQVVSCAKCRYQYELISGSHPAERSMDVPAWKRWLEFLQIMKQSIPTAVHSIVIQTPSGVGRTHRFATETPDVPAQPGERVTIALAAPSSIYRELGPFRFSPKAPKYYPAEPLCLTNHRDGRESLLLRAPSTNSKPFLLNPSVLVPLLVVLASGDAASGVIDPNLPQLLPVAAAASLAVGATFNKMVLPQLGQVWMLARMCQLENKILAVGEPSYRARRKKIRRVREGLENSLRGRMELIDSYTRISSMIEIEVDMDTDVLAAEASSNTESIAKQIQQIMELENLEERWRLQAEANDEVERLFSSESLSSEQIHGLAACYNVSASIPQKAGKIVFQCTNLGIELGYGLTLNYTS